MSPTRETDNPTRDGDETTPTSSRGERPHPGQRTGIQRRVHQDRRRETGDKKGHGQPKHKKDLKSGKCFNCGEFGHRQAECSLKVHKIDAISPQRLSNSLRRGHIFGKAHNNILLDSRAEISLVRKSILPESCKTQGTVIFKTPAARVVKQPGALVEVKMGTRSFTIMCGVVEDAIISVPLLIGDNLPNLSMLQLMAETAPPGKGLDLEQLIKHRGEADQTRGGAETPPQPEDITNPPEEQGPARVNRLQLVNVVTRAQAKRRHQTEEEDEQVTKLSEAQITRWEDIQVPLEEGEPDEMTGENGDSVTQRAQGTGTR